MYKIPKSMIFEAMDMAEIKEEAFRDDYSGRGMNGRKCVGITVEYSSDILKFMVALGALGEQNDEEFSAMRMASGTAVDGSGEGTIYYWSHLELS